MRLSLEIQNIGGAYNAQVGIDTLSAHEMQLFEEFGNPTIDAGGDFSGTISRPGQVNTTLTIADPTSGVTATGTPIVDAYGVITGATLIGGGSGYTGVPAITVAGDGTGAVLTASLAGGIVTGIVVNNGGLGYHVTPVAVAFSLPTLVRRLRQDFPIKQVFDLADYADADARAKLWIDTIQARILAAKTAWLSRESPLEVSNLTTI